MLSLPKWKDHLYSSPMLHSPLTTVFFFLLSPRTVQSYRGEMESDMTFPVCSTPPYKPYRKEWLRPSFRYTNPRWEYSLPSSTFSTHFYTDQTPFTSSITIDMVWPLSPTPHSGTHGQGTLPEVFLLPDCSYGPSSVDVMYTRKKNMVVPL